jgi:hypothetical protein
MSPSDVAEPIADVTAAILPSEHPLLLLPIRIETALESDELQIRVYPDEIHLDRRPEQPGGRPTARPRLLPDRFVATGWRDGARVFAVAGAPIDETAMRLALDLGADEPEAGLAWLWDFTTAEQAGMALRVALDQPRLDRVLVFGVRGALEADATQAALADLLGARDDIRFVAPGEATNQIGAAAAAPAAPTPGASEAAAGALLASALGLPAGSLADLAGADRDEESVARAMNAALWPATWGYFLTHRLGRDGFPGVAAPDLERGRRAFVDHVRAGGPLPALRIGDQPYGFLPATTLDAWVPGDEPLGAGALNVVRNARSTWLAAADGLPTADGGPDDLLEVLRNSPTAASLWARTLIGPLYAANLLRYVGIQSWPQWLEARNVLSQRAQAAANLAWMPTVAKAAYAPDAYALRTPYVAETTPAFLTWLSGVDLAAPPVISTAPPPVPQPAALLDVLARHATGRAFADVAGQSAPEGELLGFGWQGPLELTSGTSPALSELQAALATLAAQPLEVLERHLTASLDLASHRLDAWITAFASQRLAALRTGTPSGLRIGAFGWVEGLAPRSEAPASEGWIAAPSLGHATTAAVLRNGYRARRLEGEPPGTLAVDLSSRRVRRALRLLAGVRAGRSLGALLGEQLERALHDAELDVLIEGLRAYAPAPDGGAVDGLMITERWRDTHDLPGFALDGNRAPVSPLLDALDDTLDAVGDLTLAEGVHQIVAGNPVRAGALFDALGRGEQPPPELAVTRTPRGAVHHAVSLLVALPRHARRPAGLWPATPDSVRAAAEPVADAWAARVLGRAKNATLAVEWRTAEGGVVARADGTLADTGLAPLDIVYLSGQPAELDGWLMRAVSAPTALPDGATPVLAQAPEAALELSRTLRRVLVAARRATDADLDPDTQTAAAVDADAAQRAHAAAQTLDAAIAAATGAADGDLAGALVALARFGVPDCLPPAGEPADAQRARADRALAVARTRAASAAAATDPSAILGALLDEPFALFGTVHTGKVQWRDAPEPATAVGWLDQVGRARSATGALSDLLLCDEALGRPSALALSQLPLVEGEPSVIDDAAALTEPRHVALVHLPAGAKLPKPAAALLVDAWVEPVPNPQETAGVAFHLERPTSQPPQACLIAVPPDPAAPWSTATLEAVLAETLDAARMRAVPAEALQATTQLLPALQFAFNPAGETISTNFSALAEA